MNTLLEIIKETRCLLWGIITLVTIYMILKNICLPLFAQRLEEKKKQKDFERELKWHLIKDTETSRKTKEDMQKCKDELDELKKKEKDLKAKTESMDKEKEEFEKDILEAKIKAYDEILKSIRI